jgi:hypothetical protein
VHHGTIFEIKSQSDRRPAATDRLDFIITKPKIFKELVARLLRNSMVNWQNYVHRQINHLKQKLTLPFGNNWWDI